jgi:flavin reductase (DIM6/NTAB) family NADH-FMN oxidoreductase RutF
MAVNPFKFFGESWVLITAGTRENFNTMTASWGGLGCLWGRNVATVYVRPQRYTYKFLEENESFSICTFDKKYKDVLNFCGTNSGRDIDKMKETGLSAVFSENAPYFKQAEFVFICKKIYRQDMSEDCFSDSKIIDDWYAQDLQKNQTKESIKSFSLANFAKTSSLHRIYIGEIEKCLKKG